MATCRRNRIDRRRRRCINDVTDDILIEILNRTDCRFVMRCKSVCKRWLNLISQPDFIRGFVAHRTQNQQQPRESLILHRRNVENRSLSFLFDADEKISISFLPGKFREIEIVGSCSGLLLCLDVRMCEYYICNPFTEQWVKLGCLHHTGSHVYVGFIRGQVSMSPGSVSFKVIVIGCTLSNEARTRHIKMYIFSSECGKWVEKKITLADEIGILGTSRSAVIYDEKMHWPTSDNKILVCVYRTNKIHYFDGPSTDIEEEETYPDDASMRLLLGLWQNTLRLSQIIVSDLKIWQLKDYESKEWSLTHKVNLYSMSVPHPIRSWLAKEPYYGPHPRVLNFSRDDQDVVYLHMTRGFVVSCNLRDDNWKILCETWGSRFSNIVVPLLVPHWPTPLPSISRPAVSF
ncbi:F-box protein At5g49610-like [Mercurialis annua]|uniref:F-box protein At5g49610-like n=1 Tax=Mercurialis annua TaxID=3986 RepID=UPI00215FB8A5|nr:F-box protein At5g49610-like [Mercurialis annua]